MVEYLLGTPLPCRRMRSGRPRELSKDSYNLVRAFKPATEHAEAASLRINALTENAGWPPACIDVQRVLAIKAHNGGTMTVQSILHNSGGLAAIALFMAMASPFMMAQTADS